jgi:hypothetical protein
VILLLAKPISAILDYVCTATTSACVCDHFLYHDDYLIITYFLTLPSKDVQGLNNVLQCIYDEITQIKGSNYYENIYDFCTNRSKIEE